STTTVVLAVPIVSEISTLVDTEERTSTSCEAGANPLALTLRWYGLNGTLVKRKEPSLAVFIVRARPLTTLVISTVAFPTVFPEGSRTVPSMDPELPVCANTTATTKTTWTTKSAATRNPYRILPPIPYGNVRATCLC